MSVQYVAVPNREPAEVGPLLEGTKADATPIDGPAIRAALGRRLAERRGGTLAWEGEGSYVFVDVRADHVLVTHGTGGGDEQIDVIMDVIDRLQGFGLHVWDPQQGSWFPG